MTPEEIDCIAGRLMNEFRVEKRELYPYFRRLVAAEARVKELEAELAAADDRAAKVAQATVNAIAKRMM